ncbi:hypothetical protein NC652_040391 [Populus alba x Populus x berolinensis]|nr:hypothetical protein NC652_040391 [Populus alba x Populus x berolinensis]
MRAENERLPPWTTWKGLLDTHPASMANEQLKYLRHQAISEGAYPPWLPYLLLRDPNVRFLVADWERLPGFGIGAQLAGMCGLLAIAINEKRVLTTPVGHATSFQKTSQECRDRAFELLGNKEALERGIITTKDSYQSKEIWTGRTPRQAYTILDEIPNSVYVWLDEYCPKCCFWEGSREDGSYESPNRMGQRFC